MVTCKLNDILIILGAIIIVLICYCIYTLWRLHYQRARYEQALQEKQTIIDSRAKSSSAQRSTIKGQLAEQFFSLMPENTHEPSDMRFMGDFCDYVAVDNYTRCKDDGHDYIEAITFIEIKTGNAQLSRHQKLIRDAIQAGRVRWELIRLP